MSNSLRFPHLGYMSLLLVLVGLALFGVPDSSFGAPVSRIEQRLDKKASKVQFRVKSNAANFDGSFSDVSGWFNLDPENLSRSDVTLALNVESVKLPPEQLLPALLVQTVIQRLKSKVATFKSTAFVQRSKNLYDVDGMVTWQGKTRQTVVPVEIVTSSPMQTKIRCALKGGLKSSSDPVAVALGGNGAGEAVSNLIFIRQ